MPDRQFFHRRQLLKGGASLALYPLLTRCAALSEPPPAPVAFDDIPRSDYGFATLVDEVAAAYDLSGKTIVVTGCNSGLGLESMRAMAAQGAHVIGTARTLEKAETACASVDGKTTPVVLELTNMDSVTSCSESIAALGKDIDVLMCNAGIMALPKLETVDVGGVTLEKQFVVNHLGHYLLTRQLIPQLQSAQAPRVVNVSSSGHRLAPPEGIPFDNLGFAEGYKPFKAYGVTKLANILMVRELTRRHQDDWLTANAIHPGVVATNLGRYMSSRPRDPNRPLRKGQKVPAQGAATQVYVACDERLVGVSGYYFEDCNPKKTEGPANDAALAAQLWDVSEELVARWL